VRCIRCLQTGKWPRRSTDVEEVDVDKLKEMVHVSDQDIQSYLDNQDNHMAPIQQDDAFGKSIASLEFSDNDIKNFLGDVSDNELTQYMDEHGGLKDYPTN